MLYDHLAGVNAAPREAQVLTGSDQDPSLPPYKRDRRGLPLPDTTSLSGLAATVPHRANVTVVTPGGGGVIGPADAGGGGGGGSVPPGSQSIGVTSPPSGRTRPGGTNTSPFTAAPGLRQAAQVARVKFQPSKQGARISMGERLSPMTPQTGSNYPAGGLFGLAGVDGFFTDAGNFLKRAVTPPKPVRSFATKTWRVALPTAVGAATGFVTSGFNPIGAVAGGAYGVSKGIYGLRENAPLGRTTYQTLLPAAGAGLVTYGLTTAFAPSTQAALTGTGQGATGLTASGLPSTTGTSWIVNAPQHVLTGQIATPELIAGTVPAGTTGSLTAADMIAAPLTPAGNPIVAASSGLKDEPIFGGAFDKGATYVSKAGGETALGAKLPAEGASFGAQIAKSVIDTTVPILALRSIMGGGATAGQPGYASTFDPGMPYTPGASYPSPGSLPYSSGSGDSGGSSAPESILAGPSPVTMVVVGGIAVSFLLSMLKKRRGA